MQEHDTQIHCPNCYEDMNSADWSANNGCCTHCGEHVDPDWERHQAFYNPLAAVSRRLEVTSLLGSRPTFVHTH